MSPSTSCSRIRASISKEPWVHVFSLRGRVPCLLQASPPLLFLFLLPPQISRPWLFSLCPGSFSSTNKASQVLPNTKKKKKKIQPPTPFNCCTSRRRSTVLFLLPQTQSLHHPLQPGFCPPHCPLYKLFLCRAWMT